MSVWRAGATGATGAVRVRSLAGPGTGRRCGVTQAEVGTGRALCGSLCRGATATVPSVRRRRCPADGTSSPTRHQNALTTGCDALGIDVHLRHPPMATTTTTASTTMLAATTRVRGGADVPMLRRRRLRAITTHNHAATVAAPRPSTVTASPTTIHTTTPPVVTLRCGGRHPIASTTTPRLTHDHATRRQHNGGAVTSGSACVGAEATVLGGRQAHTDCLWWVGWRGQGHKGLRRLWVGRRHGQSHGRSCTPSWWRCSVVVLVVVLEEVVVVLK